MEKVKSFKGPYKSRFILQALHCSFMIFLNVSGTFGTLYFNDTFDLIFLYLVCGIDKNVGCLHEPNHIHGANKISKFEIEKLKQIFSHCFLSHDSKKNSFSDKSN